MKASFVIILTCLISILRGQTQRPTQNYSLNTLNSTEYGDLSEDEDDDAFQDDDDSETNEKGRWSYLLVRQERHCLALCQKHGKPFGRLIGARCQCLCPINALQLNLCTPGGGTTNCYPFCRKLGYRGGGNCLFNPNCFCFCRLKQFYDPSIVYYDYS